MLPFEMWVEGVSVVPVDIVDDFSFDSRCGGSVGEASLALKLTGSLKALVRKDGISIEGMKIAGDRLEIRQPELGSRKGTHQLVQVNPTARLVQLPQPTVQTSEMNPFTTWLCTGWT